MTRTLETFFCLQFFSFYYYIEQKRNLILVCPCFSLFRSEEEEEKKKRKGMHYIDLTKLSVELSSCRRLIIQMREKASMNILCVSVCFCSNCRRDEKNKDRPPIHSIQAKSDYIFSFEIESSGLV